MPVFLYDLLLKRCTSVHFWGQIWTKPFLMKACAIPPWRSMNNKSPSSLLKSIQMNHIPALCWAKIGWIEATTAHSRKKHVIIFSYRSESIRLTTKFFILLWTWLDIRWNMFFQFQATLGGGISSSSPGSPRSPSSAGASSAWVGNSQKLKTLQSQVANPKSLQTSLGESKKSPHYPLGHCEKKPGFSCLFFLYDLLLKRCTSVHFSGQIWTKPFLMKACAIPPWTSMNNISCLQQISLKPAQTNSNEPYPCALLGKNRLDRSDNNSPSTKKMIRLPR